MGFYDGYNFDGLKFLANIKLHPEYELSVPCQQFLTAVRSLSATRQSKIPPPEA